MGIRNIKKNVHCLYWSYWKKYYQSIKGAWFFEIGICAIYSKPNPIWVTYHKLVFIIYIFIIYKLKHAHNIGSVKIIIVKCLHSEKSFKRVTHEDLTVFWTMFTLILSTNWTDMGTFYEDFVVDLTNTLPHWLAIIEHYKLVIITCVSYTIDYRNSITLFEN